MVAYNLYLPTKTIHELWMSRSAPFEFFKERIENEEILNY
jgi:hypothetical protein